MKRPSVEDLARLARLRLTPQETLTLQGDLDRMLGLFQALEEVDTQGVEPSPYPLELADILRNDKEIAGLTQAQTLSNAPLAKEGSFQVPSILKTTPEEPS